MKITFKDEALSELYETGKTKDRKYKQLCKNKKLVDGYIRAVSIMYRTETTRELHEYSFLHYERLAHDPRSSIRIVNGKSRTPVIHRNGRRSRSRINRN